MCDSESIDRNSKEYTEKLYKNKKSVVTNPCGNVTTLLFIKIICLIQL